MGEGVAGGQLAPLPVEIPRQRQQGRDGPVVLQAVLVVGDGGAGLVGGDGSGVPDHLTGFEHLGVGHPGEPLHVVFAEARGIGGVRLEAVDVVPDEVPVDPAVLDEDIAHAQRQRPVGARPGPQVQVGQLFHRGGDPGVDDDELGARRLGPLGGLGVEIAGIVPLEGPAQVQIAVGHVRPGQLARRHLPGHPARRHAGGGLGAVVEGAEGVGEPPQPGAVPLVVAAEEGHRVRPVLLPDGQQLPGDLAVCLVPGDGLEPALSPLPHPAQGGEDPVLPVDVAPVGQPLGAKAAPAAGVLVHPLHLQQLPVLHVGVDAAVVGGAADGAHRVLDLDACLRAGDLRPDQFFQLIHGSSPPSCR